MSIERLLDDARRGYAAGMKPVRREFDGECGGGCAVTAAGYRAMDDDMTVSEWARTRYGLTEDQVWAFMFGFDGHRLDDFYNSMQEPACWRAGRNFAREVFK